MTAQPVQFHGANRPPHIAITIRDIRRHLAPTEREDFDTELDEAVSGGDMAAVNAVKQRWWALALIETDPKLKAALDAADRGDVEYFASPFATR